MVRTEFKRQRSGINCQFVSTIGRDIGRETVGGAIRLPSLHTIGTAKVRRTRGALSTTDRSGAGELQSLCTGVLAGFGQ